MLKTFYIQTETGTNRITDCIGYAHEGYAAVELETPLPPNILAGCYKLEAGLALYVQEWDKDQKIIDLENELLNTKLAMAELVEQQQADKLNNQLALAELIESIMEGGTVA
ncbi:hypothetical protein LNN31_18785 [Acetobacterium wieringae]|uniref:Phage protein n=1 Tax=Acetobacterium wieringae TaxID=52694 RepID=A0ABY6HGU3_9FIRM|nr:hypothetical protein [Acetobacterium wieringae]UYO62788.1 hypothetical protein LNN31_18785 [Acetobacterium wieringae]